LNTSGSMNRPTARVARKKKVDDRAPIILV
jgi:hypothetical protein